jgi:2-iminobutanoate/2-iminopropanoate deaminase
MESIIEDDLRTFGAESIAVGAGGIAFTGGLRAANLRTDTAHGHNGNRALDRHLAAIGTVANVALVALGSGLHKTAKAKAHLTNMADAPAVRSSALQMFGDEPAMTVIGARLAAPEDLVTMDLVAGVESAPRSFATSSRTVAASLDNLVFLGASPLDGAGHLPTRPDLAAQGRAALGNLVAVLSRAGATVDDVIKVNNTTGSWHSFNLYNEVYNEVFASSQAARCSVSGVLEDPRALIEVEAVASVARERSFVDSTQSGVGRAQFAPDPRTLYLPTIGPCKGPHTHGARAGKFVFIAGECPYDANDRLVGWGDVEAQTVQTMRNVQLSLEALGASCADVVRTTVTLSDARLREDFERGYRQFFKPPYPARSLVATPLGQYGILVEIEAIAVIGASIDGVAVVGSKYAA